jgi:Domain of unknown function (DUF3859)
MGRQGSGLATLMMFDYWPGWASGMRSVGHHTPPSSGRIAERPMQFIASFLLLLLAGGAFAQTPKVERLEISDFGTYSVDREAKGRDPHGVKLATGTNIQHQETKTAIPAQIGTSFGFRSKIIGEPEGAAVTLRKVIVFPAPGLQPTPGKRVTRDESTIEATIGETRADLYTLEDNFELVPGTWVVELWFGGRKLATESFTLERTDASVKPDAASKPGATGRPKTSVKTDRPLKPTAPLDNGF